jgi:hypothetical protein
MPAALTSVHDLTDLVISRPAGPTSLAPDAEGVRAPFFPLMPSRYSKSFGSLIRLYGRGKGLSIAALRSENRVILRFPQSRSRAIRRDHYGSHLGINRGSFKASVAFHLGAGRVGGGRRG